MPGGSPSLLAHLVMLTWVPLVLVLFALMRPRRAVIAGFLGGWLFLPEMGYTWSGIPDYDKASATALAVVLGLVVFDKGRAFVQFRPHWIDAPMVIWCLIPFASSISNGLGVYDGISSSLEQMIAWGLPYLIGRAVFTQLEDLHELAMGLVLGGLVYVPFCLWEIRMSPHLHEQIYGFMQHSFAQTKRMGGWRPMVFMGHGLMVSAFMSITAVAATWLWYSGTWRRLFGIPTGVLALLLLVTAVLCKSAAAIGLLTVGLVALFTAYHGRTAIPILLLVLAPPTYLTLRIADIYDGQSLVPLARQVVGSSRAASLQFRLEEEAVLLAHAMERPLLGWGGWNRHRQVEGEGLSSEEQMRVTDSLWIITLGQRGIIGVGALVGVLLLVPCLVFWLLPIRQMGRASGAPLVALSLVGVLFMLDSLLNAMVNPVYLLVLGGPASLLTQRLSAASKNRVASARDAPTATPGGAEAMKGGAA